MRLLAKPRIGVHVHVLCTSVCVWVGVEGEVPVNTVADCMYHVYYVLLHASNLPPTSCNHDTHIHIENG